MVLIGEQSRELKMDQGCVTGRIPMTVSRWGSDVTGTKVWWEWVKGRTWAAELGALEQLCRNCEPRSGKTTDGQDEAREGLTLFYLGKITAYLCIVQIIWWKGKLEESKPFHELKSPRIYFIKAPSVRQDVTGGYMDLTWGFHMENCT